MRPTSFPGPAREALLSLARARSQREASSCCALFAVVEAGDALSANLRRDVGTHGLTEPGFLLIAHFLNQPTPGYSVGDLARVLPLTRPVIAEALGRLEISGLIAREPAAGRRGSFAVKVSASGRRAFSSALAECVKSVVRMMSALDEKEIKALDFACVRLRESAERAA